MIVDIMLRYRGCMVGNTTNYQYDVLSIIVKEKITDKSLVSLENKAQDLKDKIRNYISRLEDSFL